MLYIPSFNTFEAWNRAIPPPGKIPLTIALLAELRASTMRSLASPFSDSVLPPTEISAILAYILAYLSL